MAASLLIACGLQEQKLPKHIHISEESSIDGSFLISSILGQRVRVPNSKTLLVCLHQNFKHYLNAGLRLGYNLQMHNGKSLTVIDVVNDIGTQPISCKWLADNPTETLYKAICDELAKLQGSVTVIIDNLEGLMNLGASAQDLYTLCVKLQKFLKESSFESHTLATKLNNCNLFEMTDTNLEHLSELHLR
uniref:Elongator complex protein 6 n=1 Tax=Megaselia scalaris TaxID=36166 RepID=T1GMB6_MEGSC